MARSWITERMGSHHALTYVIRQAMPAQCANAYNHHPPMECTRHPRQIIQELLKDRGLSATRAAALAGVSQPTLTRYLRGDADNLEMPTWQALARLLRVTVSQLLGETALYGSPETATVVHAMEHLPPVERKALAAAAQAMLDSVESVPGALAD